MFTAGGIIPRPCRWTPGGHAQQARILFACLARPPASRCFLAGSCWCGFFVNNLPVRLDGIG